ncbi:putative DNA-binding domain-containing protein [Pseudomonas fluorescens]|jgi:hypothetical protein|uniref:HvfC/BufC family peptide modification chaperone n=1 Tax=Pseudomonas fluorescens TaxID=294 RepID=UPI0037FB9130
MTLAQWQRDFRAWLIDAPDDCATRLGGGSKAGLDVYQNNYRAQLVGCLEEAFPRVRSWIGDELFHNAVITHIDTHPPHDWTLDAYPRGFGKTLAVMFPKNPDLHELAWIESAVSEVFVAADSSPLAIEALSTVDWDTAHLCLTPSLMTRVLTTNAESIWSALWEEAPVPEGSMLPEPCGLIVWRRQVTSRLKQVDALELEALLHLKEHGSFATLCDLLVERLGEEQGISKSGELLASWLASELITGIETA